MKKYIILLLLFISILISGCSRDNEKCIIKKLNKKINNINSYKISGDLEIVNNDNVYNYLVEVSYKDKSFYKVVLTNTSNSHTQIILKNNDGVYVLTPSLNKSFKFQSDWPYSNSQIYLLKSLLKDINNSKNRTFKKYKTSYIINTSVNYPNNKRLVNQSIKLDKNLNIKEVKVYDNNGIANMTMVFNKKDYSINLKDSYFDLNNILNTFNNYNNEVINTSKLIDTIYPLMVPNGTKLVKEEKIKLNNGERIIMTFDGDKPFILVEETAYNHNNFTIIPTFGEPYRLMDTIGSISNNSLNWTSSGVEYYLISDVLNKNDLVEIAQSINVLPTMK